jgi:hypothetical protein
MSVALLISRDDLLDPVVRSSVLSATTAGLILVPPEGDEVRISILRIFDGDPSNKNTRRPHEYYREMHPPQTAEECLLEADWTLRSYYGLGGWVKDPTPLPGFQRSWSRKAT